MNQCVEHEKENDAKIPHHDEDIIDTDGDILGSLFHSPHQHHRLNYDYVDEEQPGQYRMVDPVLQEGDAEEGCYPVQGQPAPHVMHCLHFDVLPEIVCDC